MTQLACCAVPPDHKLFLSKLSETFDFLTCWADGLVDALEEFFVDLLPEIDLNFADIELLSIEIPLPELEVFDFDESQCKLTPFEISSTTEPYELTIPGLEFNLKKDILDKEDEDGKTFSDQLKEDCSKALGELLDLPDGDCCCEKVLEPMTPCVDLHVSPMNLYDPIVDWNLKNLGIWIIGFPRCSCCRDGQFITTDCYGIPGQATVGVCGTSLPSYAAGETCGASGLDCLCSGDLKCAAETSFNRENNICCMDVEGEPLSGYEFCRGSLAEGESCARRNDDCAGDLKCARRTSISEDD
eukprot:CAMPEP_0178885156 /NCGR_PEP_ID=MMETSP0747-20121128/15197_1 /TAXON_ID=913974 /ORGANISM="Nitzschia punctata, Strain CCMP561" /LENGTH=299 /DNA_ID=CAMNT_0020553799 /DNA_START=80 /DNA_END=976 /DNA_ORIENTATION=+